MTDQADLLHNMSTPARSVIKYAGLSGLATKSGFGGTGIGNLKYSHRKVFGCYFAFRLPKELRIRSAALILKRLGVDAGPDPEDTLLALIERRTAELPLPDGCMVKPSDRNHPSPWPDPLAALAIITKSSANVWLRTKTPSLSSLGKRGSVSLLVPPGLADRLTEPSR